MEMNLHSLRTFLAVAKNRGISRSMSELHLTQPAVSRQILALEESLGIPLFIRKGRFLSLTEAGQILQQYATRILQLLAEAREEIDSLKGLVEAGTVSFDTLALQYGQDATRRPMSALKVIRCT